MSYDNNNNHDDAAAVVETKQESTAGAEKEQAAECCGCHWCWWISAPGIIPIFVISILLGCSNGFSSAEIPNLLNASFGDDSYEISGYTNAVKGIYLIIAGVIAGSLSDLVGRRWPIIIGLLVSSIAPAVYIITGNFEVFWFVDILAGVLFVIMSLLYSSVADIFKGENSAFAQKHASAVDLSKDIAVVNSVVFSLYLAMIFVSKIGDMVSTRIMFLLTLISNLAAVAVAVVWLPNTGKKEKKQQPQQQPEGEDQNASDHGDRSPLLAVNTPAAATGETAPVTAAEAEAQKKEEEAEEEEVSCRVVFKRIWDLISTNPKVLLVCAIGACNTSDMQIFSTAILLYLKDSLDMSADDISDFLIAAAIMSLVFVFVMVFLGQSFIVKNVKSLILAALFGGFCMSVAFSFVKTKVEAIAVQGFLLLALAGMPSVSAAAALVVDKKHYGLSVGLLQAARSFMQTVTPFLYGATFSAAEHTSFPGWPFFIGAGFCAVGGIMTIWLKLPDGSAAAEEGDVDVAAAENGVQQDDEEEQKTVVGVSATE